MNYEKIVKYFEDAAIFYRCNSNGAAIDCDKAARVITELLYKIKPLEKENAELLDRVKSAETRCDTLEKIVKEYQNEIVPGYAKRAENAERILALLHEE